MIDIKGIRKQAQEDFEKAWSDSAGLLPKNTVVSINGRGKPHPVRNMIQKSRRILLYMGFDEVENRTIIPEADVKKQYGSEAYVILDRIFYLARLPRPDIGLGRDKEDAIKKIIGSFDIALMKDILRRYKKGEIEGDDFVEELVSRLKISPEQATKLIGSVFVEFSRLRPEPSRLTLRSHMTAAWFETLASMQGREMPVALFSVGPRYRNEQKEDRSHLRVHNSVSIVIMHPEMSLEAGKKIISEMVRNYGFENVEFRKKKATSKYYAKGMEEEVFVRHNSEMLEIGDIGMYSPIALANYNISYPVFNAGFGIERLVMVLNSISDIRQAVFPQFFSKSWSDKELSESLSFIYKPETDKGKKIAKAIELCARLHKDDRAPCRAIAYEDNMLKVELVEKEQGTRLLGPAALNKVYVLDGSILAGSEAKGTPAGITFVQAIANEIAYRIENERIASFKKKIVKSLSNINLKLSSDAMQFIKSNHKKISIYGPVFLELEITYKSRG